MTDGKQWCFFIFGQTGSQRVVWRCGPPIEIGSHYDDEAERGYPDEAQSLAVLARLQEWVESLASGAVDFVLTPLGRQVAHDSRILYILVGSVASVYQKSMTQTPPLRL